jgi:cytochrome c oxidase assembly protein subunit 15
MSIINRTAWIALVCIIVLVLVGATVRVTGSGLGCPDWPFCWGRIIPPTSVDQIDVEKIDIAKYKRRAIRRGIDPETITKQTVLDSFNPVHTWIEFINRLTSLPLGLSTLVLAIASFWASRHRGWVIGLSWFCLIDVLVNAVMGAIVVRSGLSPGIITLHMALAFLLIAVLVTVIWLTRESTPQDAAPITFAKPILIASLVFFTCLFCEGLMGSQLREQTDELAHAAAATARESGSTDPVDRSQWIEELESTLIYKVHRSFSWTLFVTSGLVLFWTGKHSAAPLIEPKLIFGFVIAMMLMGIVLAHVAILQVIQVLHVGTTAVMLAVTWHWILRLWSRRA